MLWFFIVLAIAALGFLGVVICNHYDLYELDVLCCLVGVFGVIVLVIMASVAIVANTNTDAYVASMQQRREALVYQFENNVYENDNDIGKHELYEQIREWNEKLAKNRKYQDSTWVGMFYADVYDQLEFIPLK